MSKIKTFSVIVLSLMLLYCNKKANNNEETILKGKTKILVDETLTPIVEDQLQVFESDYDAKITLVSKSEAEVLQNLMQAACRQ